MNDNSMYNSYCHIMSKEEKTIEKLKSALYCRVSTEHEDQLTSYKAQMEYKNEQFDIIQIYNEQVSGKLLYKRKEQQKLLYDAGIDVSFHDKQPIFSISQRPPLFDIIIPSLTVVKRKNRCIHCVCWIIAIFCVVTVFSIFYFPLLSF